jgi:hypothetical protein
VEEEEGFYFGQVGCDGVRDNVLPSTRWYLLADVQDDPRKLVSCQRLLCWGCGQSCLSPQLERFGAGFNNFFRAALGLYTKQQLHYNKAEFLLGRLDRQNRYADLHAAIRNEALATRSKLRELGGQCEVWTVQSTTLLEKYRVGTDELQKLWTDYRANFRSVDARVGALEETLARRVDLAEMRKEATTRFEFLLHNITELATDRLEAQVSPSTRRFLSLPQSFPFSGGAADGEDGGGISAAAAGNRKRYGTGELVATLMLPCVTLVLSARLPAERGEKQNGGEKGEGDAVAEAGKPCCCFSSAVSRPWLGGYDRTSRGQVGRAVRKGEQSRLTTEGT